MQRIPIKKSEVMRLAKAKGKWTLSSKLNGRGDYGRDEIYSLDGRAIFVLSIAYSHPYTQAYRIVEN